MRRVPLGVLLVLPLAFPTAAHARTVRASNVSAFSGEAVTCLVVRVVDGFAGSGIECSSRAVPRGVGGSEGDPFVALGRTGASRVAARGDFPGFSSPRRRLRIGDVWRPGHSATGIVCRVRSSGLRCTNRSGRGFRLSRTALGRF